MKRILFVLVVLMLMVGVVDGQSAVDTGILTWTNPTTFVSGKTLVPSQSTQGDYDNFNNNGSLKVHGNWKGYLVSRAAWDYDNVTKTLKVYVLTVQTDIFSNPKKEATFNNLKKDLKFECDGEWESHGLNDSLFSRTDYSQCALQMSSDGSYRVTVTIK